jgi:hypothetical protein
MHSMENAEEAPIQLPISLIGREMPDQGLEIARRM